MSRFYGEIQGNRGEASRMGSEKSGFHGHIRGWKLGIKVYCDVDDKGRDKITVFTTGGSKNPGTVSKIATLIDNNGEIILE